MYKKILFGSTSESYLELKPAVGDSNYVSSVFGSSATIVSRRAFRNFVTPVRGVFTEPAETVNALYSSLNGYYNNDVFYNKVERPFIDSDGNSDATYTPTALNDISVTYASGSTDISGDLFKFEVIGDQFRIVQKESAGQPISIPTDVTFTIPYFYTEDTTTGQGYVSILTISAPITIVEIPLPVTNIATTSLGNIPTEYLTTLSWTASPSTTVESYRVVLTTSLSDGSIISERVVNTSQTELIIPDPYPDSTISVSITPKTDSGTLGIVSTYSFAVPVYTIPLVTITSVIRTVANTMTVNWEYLRDPLMSFMVHVYEEATGVEYTNSYPDKPERSTVLTDIPAGIYTVVVEGIDYNGTDGRKTSAPFTGVEVVDPVSAVTLVTVEYGDGVDLTWERNTLNGTFNINVLDSKGDLVGTPYLITSTGYTGTLTIRELAPAVYGFQPEIVLSSGSISGSVYPDINITGIGPTPVVKTLSANGYVVTLTWAQDFGTSFVINVLKDGSAYGTPYNIYSETVRSYDMTFTEAGVYSFQIDANIFDAMADTTRTYSGPISKTITLPGGSGNPGDKNNGDTGHNNMAELEYNYPDWAASVSQTNTITVLGEDSTALPDETIVINVSLASLKECVAYDSNWSPLTGEAAGTQPLPKVEFRPSEAYAAKAEMDAMFALLKEKGTGTVGDRTFTDAAAAPHDKFGKILINDVTFTGSVLDSQDLPKVAIRSIVEGDITVDELTTTVAKVDTETSASHKAYLEGLFEQLVAANRVKLDDAASTNAAGWGSCKVPSLALGDSIAFKVTYSFSKTREYELDGLDSGNGNSSNKALTLSIAGQTFEIKVGADGVETSDAYSRSYAFKLVAVA